MEDELSLSTSLDTYKLQLAQVESSLEVASEDMKDDLQQLQLDLKQLIQLTEESLLSMKKSHLLALLDSANVYDQTTSAFGGVTSCNSITQPSTEMDAEFASFQQAIADDLGKDVSEGSLVCQTGSGTVADTDRSVNYCDIDEEGSEDEAEEEEEEVEDELSGTKCRAPFSHSWGELSYHNAVILCTLPNQSQVRVLFCNPTHSSMRPCPFFLEGKCRFDDLHCRFSHGELVPADELKPFLEPSYSDVHIGCYCLARDTDDIWYHATIVELLDNEQLHVMFSANHREAKLDARDVFPLVASTDESNQDTACIDLEADTTGSLVNPGDEDNDDLPRYLWRPGQTTDIIGDWEQHTRGIGSKIMTRMGYIVGQGLGKNNEGRAEPVPIQLLPQGKSLDKIMELKELAGDGDLYSVLRKQKRHQKGINNRAAEDYRIQTNAQSSSGRVFDFINHKLNSKKSASSKGVSKHCGSSKKAINVQHISSHDLEKKSSRHLNIQLVKTHEEVTNAQREIARLRTALERNEKQDLVMAKQIRAKLSSMQDYVTELQTSETFIKQHQMARHARDKLSKF